MRADWRHQAGSHQMRPSLFCACGTSWVIIVQRNVRFEPFDENECCCCNKRVIRHAPSACAIKSVDKRCKKEKLVSSLPKSIQKRTEDQDPHRQRCCNQMYEYKKS